MPQELAVSMVNDIKEQLTNIVRNIVEAAKDGKVSPSEGIQLGFAGMNLSMTVARMLQGRSKALQNDVLYVLENSKLTIEE